MSDEPPRPDFFDRYEELVVTVVSCLGGGALMGLFAIWLRPTVTSNVEALVHWLGLR